MATIRLTTQENLVTGAIASASAITDDATDEVLDLEFLNTWPTQAFTAQAFDTSTQEIVATKTVPANSSAFRLTNPERNQLQNRHFVVVQTHGQAQLASDSKRGRMVLLVTLVPA